MTAYKPALLTNKQGREIGVSQRQENLYMTNSELLIRALYQMQLTRALNDRFLDLKAAGEIHGPIHRSTGQEAVGIAAGAVLRKDDYVISNHRGWAHWIGKGLEPNKLCAEIYGKESGFCRGKGGEMLIADLSNNLMSTTIVGGGLPLAVGLGMAIRRQCTDQVVVCFFGDGASNEGAFHESLNFAALQKVPVAFVCENNAWALSTHARRSTAVRDISIRAVAYDIPGYIVDGNDLFDLKDLFAEVAAQMRAGGGPVLIEAKTYRVGSFSSNDRESGYQPAEEIKRWRAKDPIKRFGEQLIELGLLDADELLVSTERARENAERAIEFGRSAPYPKLSALYEDVLAVA